KIFITEIVVQTAKEVRFAIPDHIGCDLCILIESGCNVNYISSILYDITLTVLLSLPVITGKAEEVPAVWNGGCLYPADLDIGYIEQADSREKITKRATVAGKI